MNLGNMGNMQGMMKQVQQMQKNMEDTQKELEETVFEVTDRHQLVQVKVNGKREILDLVVSKELIDPEDADMMQDLIIATINDAMKKVEDEIQAKMGQFTQGLNFPF